MNEIQNLIGLNFKKPIFSRVFVLFFFKKKN